MSLQAKTVRSERIVGRLITTNLTCVCLILSILIVCLLFLLWPCYFGFNLGES